MLMRRISKKDKIPSGPLRKAAASGVAVGVAAASLAGLPTADATCLGIFGISINDGSGGHCSSSVFSFALGLGPGTSATALGNLNAAIAVGMGEEGSGGVNAIAGNGVLDSLNLALNFGNATDGATSTVRAGDGTNLLPDNFNLAANLGGNAGLSGLVGQGPQNMDIFAGDGYLNVALNVIGNRNRLSASDGFLNFAGNVGAPFSYPNASDNDISATGNLSAAFNSQTFLGEPCSASQCGNTVTADGPLSLVVAAGVVRKLVEGNFGITLANSFNSSSFPANPNLPPANVLAASNPNKFAPTTFATGTGGSAGGSAGSQLSGAITNASKQISSSLNNISSSVSKAVNDTVSRVTGGTSTKGK